MNTSEEDKETIKNVFQVTTTIETIKYLGMPSIIGRNKRAVFGYLRDRIWRKIQQWSGKHLSKARREVCKFRFFGKIMMKV